MLDLYNQHDLALDTYPYNGTTTTCNLASAGVPTLTLTGHAHRSRVSSSINTYLDGPMRAFNAATPEDYTAIAIKMATPTTDGFTRLAEARTHLVENFPKTRLCDMEGHVDALTRAFQGMWDKWCGGGETEDEYRSRDIENGYEH